MIRYVDLGDAEAICDIYNHYVRNTVITFAETPATVEEMKSKISPIMKGNNWIVYEIENRARQVCAIYLPAFTGDLLFD